MASPTPESLKQDKQRQRRRARRWNWAAAIVSGIITYLLLTADNGRIKAWVLDHRVWIFTGILAYPLLRWLDVAIHEAGHLLAGRLAGFRFRMVSVGPCLVFLSGTGIKFRWNGRVNPWGGLTSMIPATDQQLSTRILAFNLGGPILSILAALILWPLGAWISGAATASFLLQMLAVLSLITGIKNLIPMNLGGFRTDGLRCVDLMMGQEEAENLVAMFRLYSYFERGKRLSEVPIEVLTARSTAVQPSPTLVFLELMLAEYHADHDEPTQALASMNRAIDMIHLLPPAFQSSAWLGPALLVAQLEQDATRARQYLDGYVPLPFAAAAPWHFAKAIVFDLEGNSESARRELNLAQSLAPEILEMGLRAELLEDIAAAQNGLNTG